MRKKIDINYINDFVKDKGKCLSDKYLGSKKPLKWKCNCGYEWITPPLNILYNGTWCPKCGEIKNSLKHKKYTANDLKKFAKSKGGDCIFDKDYDLNSFISTNQKYKWVCYKCGKIWFAIANSIINYGYWCSNCYVRKSKYSISTVSEIVKNNFDGYCLSDNISSVEDILKWKCSANHIFEKKLRYVLEGNWCKVCSSRLITERLYRCCLEQKLNIEFKNIRPEWLKSPKTGCCLELDIYSEKHKLAFEYNGEQHYKEVPNLNIDSNKLKKIKENDLFKKNICKQKGIKLIIIKFNSKSIEDAVKDVLNENGLLKEDYDDIKVDYSKCYSKESLKRYETVKDIVEKKGAVLLTKCSLRYYEKYEMICKNGNVWRCEYFKIVKNVSCNCLKCNKRNKTSFNDVLDMGNKISLKFIDKKYENVFFDHNWECLKCGSEIISSLNRVKVAIRNDNTICNKCKYGRVNYFLNKDNIIEELKKFNLIVINFNNKNDIEVRCDICDYIFTSNIKNLFRRKNKCKNCK